MQTSACILLMLLAVTVRADVQNVLLLISKNSTSYQQLVKSLEEETLETQNLILHNHFLPDIPSSESLDKYDLIVPVGTHATRKAFEINQNSTPILSTFIPRRTFQALIKRSPSLQQRYRKGNISALYLEQPFQRQLKLLSLIQPETKTLGTIIGPTSKDERWPLEQSAASHNWELLLEQLDKEDNPVEKLTPLISNSDAFLAIPDKSVFNRSTAKWILLMTFRQRIPLIAYSKRYVDAGAVAAVFSTPKTVALETAKLIEQWQKSPQKPLPPASYPQLFDISVNPGTARSLRMRLPPLDQLKQQLEEQ